MTKLTAVLVFLLLSSCTPKESVQINTSGIFKPLLFSIDNKNASGAVLDYQEFLLSNEPMALDVLIYNDSSYPYTNLEIAFDNAEGTYPAITFNPNTNGGISFPGMDGTCRETLASKSSCTVKLILAPRDERRYLEKIILKFKNYVDTEEHVATIKLLAGWPASLVFTNEINSYTFGEKLGISQIPIVEREISQTYSKSMTVINAGGLSAKNIRITPNEICVSSIVNNCPIGMFGAYSYIHNCPANLGPGETCDLTVNYSPKNKSPSVGVDPPEIKSINYKLNLAFDYIKDPTLSIGALNASFNSWSINIEASFRSSVTNFAVVDPVIAGNRELQNFKLSNNGYREGELKYFTIRNSSGIILAECRAKDEFGVLSCYKNSVELSLENLPFTINDTNRCLPYPQSTPKYVGVGEICNFDIIFQPSTSLTANLNSYQASRLTTYQNLQFEITYDTRWEGREKLDTRKAFNYSAKAKPSSKLIVEKVIWENGNLPLFTFPVIADFGRIALQSPNYINRKPIAIVFKNIGNEAARAVSLQDGKAQNIPLGVFSDLTTGQYKFFTNTTAGVTECGLIPEGASCTLTASFAPIGVSEQEIDDQMDVTNGIQRFKEFRINYDSGMKYTDDNRINDVNYVTLPTRALLKMHLVRKGLMNDLVNDTRNVTTLNGITAGDESQKFIHIRNIGTGPIPYIRLKNPPLTDSPFSFIPTNPSSLLENGADFDCLGLVDTTTGDILPYHSIPNGTQYGSLAAEQSCIFTLKHQKKNSSKALNISSCSNQLSLYTAYTSADINRFVSVDANPDYLWSYCPIYFTENITLSHMFFDGDVINAGYPLGTGFDTQDFQLTVKSAMQAKLAPSSYAPALTATLLRPEVVYPSLVDPLVSSKIIPELWFYGILTQTAVHENAFSTLTPFMRGDKSREVVKLIPSYADKSQYDYVYYVGSFPSEIPQFNVKIPLKNYGTSAAVIQSSSINILQGSAFAAATFYQNGTSVISDPLFTFDPANSGGISEQKMEITINYTNQRSQSPLLFKNAGNPTNLNQTIKDIVSLKILVVGLIENDYPKLTLNVEDIKLIESANTAPSEVILAPEQKSMSWNEHPSPLRLTFDAIQLSEAERAVGSYAKKILTFKNNTIHTINNFNIKFRKSTTDNMPKTPVSEFNTTDACSPLTSLAPNQSCQVILKYQPSKSNVPENYILSAVYEIQANKYVMQNIGIELFPRAPGQIIAPDFTTEVITYASESGGGTITRPSYPLVINNSPTINTIPTIIAFDDSDKIHLTNTTSTKASLLLSYQRNLKKNSLRGFTPLSSVPVNTIPLPGEYSAGDGGDYVVIHEIQYPSQAPAIPKPRVVIRATKACLFGDDELDSNIPDFEKGFDINTNATCYIDAKLYADFSYINKTIVSSDAVDMMKVASELWYYSVKRSSSASLWFHFKGTLLPNPSSIIKDFRDIQPFDSKKVIFTLPELTGSNALLGDVVGVRILMAQFIEELNNPYDKNLRYRDFRVMGPDIDIPVQWDTELNNSTYYYFRAVAIRSDGRFVDSSPKRFVGLLPGEYLSATNKIIMKTVVPPPGHYYFQEEGIVVQKYLASSSFKTYADAAQVCSSTELFITDGTSNVGGGMQVINEVAWDRIVNEPSATNPSYFTNLGFITHWLSDFVTNLQEIEHIQGYNSSAQINYLDQAKVLSMTDASNARIRKVRGAPLGRPGESFWTSYISSVFPVGQTRCMAIFN